MGSTKIMFASEAGYDCGQRDIVFAFWSYFVDDRRPRDVEKSGRIRWVLWRRKLGGGVRMTLSQA